MALPIAVSVALLASALDLAPAIGAEPVQSLSAAGQDAHRPRVAFDPKGNALVVWRRSDGANDRIQLRRRSASGNLGAIRTLSAAGQYANYPQVAVDTNGNAFVVWERYDSADRRVLLRRRSASGTLGAIKTLSAAGQDAERPQVAVDADGNAFVVWSRYDGGSWRIQGTRVKGG